MDLSSIKSELEGLKSNLKARIQALENDKQRVKGAVSADFEEQAVDTENDEVVDQLEVLGIDELALVNAALEKIENGTFGVCTDCGEKIGEARLKALPYAGICVQCADKQ